METNGIMIFNHEQFGQIRTVTMPDGQIGFIGNEVAKALGYCNYRNAIANHVDDEDKLRTQIEYAGQKREVTIINESGLYSLILSSQLPRAREFKHWVTAVVLPQIRTTGGYIPVSSEDDEKTILCKAIGIYKRTLEEKDALIEHQRPLVRFAEAVSASGDSILVGEMAKLLTQNGYEIGRTRFFSWLREHGYIFKNSTAPMQKWVEKGIFDTQVTVINTHHGQQERITTKVTGKGQRYFIDLLVK